MSTPRQLKLNLFVYPGGHHEAAWRHPDSSIDRVLDISYYQDLARRAEAEKLDAVFFADGPSLADNITYASRFRLEPFTWLSAIAAVTSRIGLIGTASTTYLEPYNAARLFASLDHLSRGRAGWNIVTTGAPDAAHNFGLDQHPVHAERYDRAREFVDVVTRLWDSWYAEAIFTAHQTLEGAQEFYGDIKRRAAGLGRDPSQLLVLPGISPFLGSTEAEARALKQELDELTQPAYSLDLLRRLLGVDLSEYDLDGPFPREMVALAGDRADSSRSRLVLDIVDREQPTIRQLLHRFAGARGHWVVAGTPEQVADQMTDWFTQGAADGFNVMPPWLTGGFEVFADQVLPILRERGLFRTEYDGRTLREHYGLDRPASGFTHPNDSTERNLAWHAS